MKTIPVPMRCFASTFIQGVFMVDESFIPADAPPGAESPALPSPGSQDIQETSSNKITSEQLHQELAELKRSFAEFARQNLPEIDQVRQELAAADMLHVENTACANALQQFCGITVYTVA